MARRRLGRDLRVARSRDRRGARLVPTLDAPRTSTAPSRRPRRRSRSGGSSRPRSAARSCSGSRGCSRTQKDELTELMSREMGKVLAEAGGDVQEAIDMSIYMAGEGRRLFGHTTPSELRDKFQMSRPHAGRRRRCDHAVELPDRDSGLEARAGARLRQHRRPQAGRGHAACWRRASSSCSARRASPTAS